MTITTRVYHAIVHYFIKNLLYVILIVIFVSKLVLKIKGGE
jgi:hypothetical protein